MRKPQPPRRGYFRHAGPRRSCLAVAVRRDGVPCLRAPHRAVAAGRRGEPSRAAAARRPGRARLPQGARARARVPRAPARAGALRRLDRARGRLGARPRGDARRNARRRRRRLPGGTHRGRLARCRGLPDPGGDAVEDRRVVLRGSRHEARAAREARVRPAALLLQRAARCTAGRRSGADPRAAREPDDGVVPAAGVRRLPAAHRAAARGLRRRSAADRAVPGRPVRDLRVQATVRRALGRGRPPLPGRRDPAAADRAARGDGRRHARRARARGRRGPSSRDGRRDVREAPWPGSAAAGRARARTRRVRAPPAPGRRRVRAAARSFAGRSLLRLRGQPVLGPRGQPRVPLGPDRRERRVRRAVGDRPRRGAHGLRGVRRRGARPARGAPRPARLPLRAVRDHGAPADDGPLRHP